MGVSQKIIKSCKQKLLTAKADILNRYHNHFSDLRERQTGGDEADQTMSILAENQLFAAQQRLRSQLSEMETALAPVERGTDGNCEETDEPIEPQRLLAIPWTRLSIEGAEIRETAPSKRA